MGTVPTSSSGSSQMFPDAAPNWKPDDSALECEICEYGFSVVRRRHHCRACGSVICSNCFTKSNQMTAELKIYGYMEPQFVCEECLPLLNDNCFPNKLKETKRFSKYLFNEIQFMNPFIYNHIYRGFAGDKDSHQFVQFSAEKYFTILIPYTFEENKQNNINAYETIDLNTIQNEFDFYQLWKTKKAMIQNQAVYPNTIELLYTIAKHNRYICDNFVFLPNDIYCYGIENGLYILPKIISLKLKRSTKQWLEEYRVRNTKVNPITRHDIVSGITNKINPVYEIQKMILRKCESLKSITGAIICMQNALYDQMIGQYHELHTKYNNAYNAFVKYKTEEKDAVNVDEYIKVMNNQSKMCEVDLVLNRNEKCAFCREIFEESFEPYSISYCHHKYCITCCNAIVLLWVRFDLYPICIVNGCFAKCSERMLYDMELPMHIKHRFYSIKQLQSCNIDIINKDIILSDYYEFVLNVLSCLDKNLWEVIESKLMEDDEVNNNLIEVLKRVNVTGIEFHEDIEDCDNQTEDDESEYDDQSFTYWKSRYFFEIGALVKEKEFRDKFICCGQCILKYSWKEIEIFMDNFSKYFDDICDKILVDTISDCYNEIRNNFSNDIILESAWMDALELFTLNICCQLNMNIAKRINIISKVCKKEIDNMQECNVVSNECESVSNLLVKCNENKEYNTGYKSKEECIRLYDIFYHCLLYHDKHQIHKLLFDDNDHKCDAQCEIYQRHNDNTYDNKRIKNKNKILKILNTRLLDRIHCYYYNDKQHEIFELYQYENEENKYDEQQIILNNLKEEVLNNKQSCCLFEIQWQILINECKLMYKTMQLKQSYYITINNRLDQYYGSISFMELMAIKLYTDYSRLKEKMIENKYSTDYYHWNRLLQILSADGFVRKQTQKMQLYQMLKYNP